MDLKKTIKKVTRVSPDMIDPIADTHFVFPEDAEQIARDYAVAFGVWYSGMEEEKVKNALKRFERETK